VREILQEPCKKPAETTLYLALPYTNFSIMLMYAEKEQLAKFASHLIYLSEKMISSTDSLELSY
jgi:hypothetical protein